MSERSRRAFLRDAALLASTAAIGGGCDALPGSRDSGGGGDASAAARTTGLTRASLRSLADAVLPESLETERRREATDAFVAWIDGYEPVAEEMHGYGYADVRYLPPDPAPAWRAQLDALDVLARRVRGAPFDTLTVDGRRDILRMALRGERGSDRLPAPLEAPHVAIALLSHWASGPNAWNLALGADVSPGTCRPLDGAARKPLPIATSPVRA